jgi:Small, acid-soluble spore proteins, alpha/beta type.
VSYISERVVEILSHKRNKISERKAEYKINKFKVESAKELGIDLNDADSIKVDLDKDKSIDDSMYVSIVRSFKKL